MKHALDHSGEPRASGRDGRSLGAALEAAFREHEVWRNQQKNQQRGQPPRPAVGPHLAARYHQLTRGKPGVGARPRPLGLILHPRHPGTLGSPPLCVPHTAAHDHQGLAGKLPWTCHASRAGGCVETLHDMPQGVRRIAPHPQDSQAMEGVNERSAKRSSGVTSVTISVVQAVVVKARGCRVLLAGERRLRRGCGHAGAGSVAEGNEGST